MVRVAGRQLSVERWALLQNDRVHYHALFSGKERNQSKVFTYF
jgi:hypothetical protein